jgi:hypothetical protein
MQKVIAAPASTLLRVIVSGITNILRYFTDGADGEWWFEEAVETRHVSYGSWLCKNALTVALMPRGFGQVAFFRGCRLFSVWKRF